MTKDELRQEIERLKAEVRRLEALVAIGNGRVNMLEVSWPCTDTTSVDPLMWHHV